MLALYTVLRYNSNPIIWGIWEKMKQYIKKFLFISMRWAMSALTYAYNIQHLVQVKQLFKQINPQAMWSITDYLKLAISFVVEIAQPIQPSTGR